MFAMMSGVLQGMFTNDADLIDLVRVLPIYYGNVYFRTSEWNTELFHGLGQAKILCVLHTT